VFPRGGPTTRRCRPGAGIAAPDRLPERFSIRTRASSSLPIALGMGVADWMGLSVLGSLSGILRVTELAVAGSGHRRNGRATLIGAGILGHSLMCCRLVAYVLSALTPPDLRVLERAASVSGAETEGRRGRGMTPEHRSIPSAPNGVRRIGRCLELGERVRRRDRESDRSDTLGRSEK